MATFSLRFLSRLITMPVAILVSVIKYYTVGTIFQRTNKEFKGSLYKNTHLCVLNHLANNYTRDDVALFMYMPVTRLFEKFKLSPLTVGLNGFGDKINNRTSWIYPTQINEAIAAYRAMVEQGYDDIILVGDSCGVNLSAAVARFIAYLDEAREHFSKFTDFDWDFSPLPQPQNVVMISPWLEPYTKPVLDPNFDYSGDLGAPDSTMGDWYIEGLDKSDVAPFVRFTDNDYASQWANVDSVNGKGRTLYIYGEREHLRHGIENFIDVITKDGDGKLEVYVEDGGIHDGLFYVESLDYMSARGAQNAVEGKFESKYAYSLVGKFLGEVL
ncbi:hypothetical protein METBIDRAFT_81719 [Metschnikowia bicuspidata var. bicuspidata NRRL YB-4993]|uniref:Alpha/beta-hydrolase n=1 Tax=Metschnikowia bicuspidata var. bicuspidata NRRL YB-4993 TaxID=869754 RepID=A0A1A0HKL9_9ASCO|nr:hypothetical protein METBIDRAFT_81719 [Metschnikowia bicuspidata var. bicuspidata NRRL YB-4993]OBA24437.1 hypothetical protein METBIDRAFT_81719 [Metschnikowia bicuspidata var. bicuspidata NRRL YB-4993]